MFMFAIWIENDCAYCSYSYLLYKASTLPYKGLETSKSFSQRNIERTLDIPYATLNTNPFVVDTNHKCTFEVRADT